MNRPPRVGEPHDEHRQLGQHAVEPDADPAEVDLRFLARRMQLGDRHDRPAGLKLAAHAADVGAHRRLGDARPRSSTRRCQIRLAVWRCLRGALRSATSHSRIVARCAPSRGADGDAGLRGGGSADLSACRTVRRCTRWRCARPRMDTPSSRRSRRICSNSSTFDNSSSFARGGHVHPSVVTGSVGGGATSGHHLGPRWGHFRVSYPLLPLLS